jgi:hypothetical protein
MLEVKASEIVTADKMRGIGPANIIFTAGRERKIVEA